MNQEFNRSGVTIPSEVYSTSEIQDTNEYMITISCVRQLAGYVT